MAMKIIGNIKHNKRFTWKDIALILLGWIIGVTWMLIWILAFLWGVA